MSEPTIRFYGTIKNGVRHYFRPELHKALLVSLEGKTFEEKLCEKFEKESTEQHSYYRGGIIKATCMQTEMFGGMSEKRIHEIFKDKFLKFVRVEELHYSGQVEQVEITVIESTGDLGKKRMSEFIDKVLNFLAEHDIHPLTPQEYYYGKYQTYVREQQS